MKKARVSAWGLVCALTAFYTVTPPAQAALLGVDWDNGNLYSVSTTNAALTLIGDTGVDNFIALELSPSGTLYGFTNTVNFAPPALYTINPFTAVSTFVGNLGDNVFEGGLAFSPAGVAYGTNSGGVAAAGLFTINLATGAITNVGTISGGSHDINGLAWRSDGLLIGLDRINNSLITINPTTAASATLAALPFEVGSIGGMAVQGNTGYLSTGGSGAGVPDGTVVGSNSLYSFDLFTGATTLIGTFSPTITGAGIGGLAIPEPATLGFFTLGAVLLLRRRNKN